MAHLNYFTFRKENFECPNCGWKGKGSELSESDFSEEHVIMDLNCPKCSEHIGFWQGPLEEEINKWKIDHPEDDLTGIL